MEWADDLLSDLAMQFSQAQSLELCTSDVLLYVVFFLFVFSLHPLILQR